VGSNSIFEMKTPLKERAIPQQQIYLRAIAVDVVTAL
jgi:hypothetical protein